MTNLTAQAIAGYVAQAATSPYLDTSPSDYAFKAGQIFAKRGYTKPLKVTMGRGYSVNVWTAANRFTVDFKPIFPFVVRHGE